MTGLDQGEADIQGVKSQVLPLEYRGVAIWAEKGRVVFDGGAHASFYRLESHVGERVIVNYGCDASVLVTHQFEIERALSAIDGGLQ